MISRFYVGHHEIHHGFVIASADAMGATADEVAEDVDIGLPCRTADRSSARELDLSSLRLLAARCSINFSTPKPDSATISLRASVLHCP